MPESCEDTFTAVGDSIADGCTLPRLDPAYDARFADGSRLAVHRDVEAMTEAVRASPGRREAAGYLRLRDWLTRLYRAEYDRFIAANIDSPLGLLTPQLARLVALGGFGRLGPRRSRRSSATSGCGGSSPSRRCTRASPRCGRWPCTR